MRQTAFQPQKSHSSPGLQTAMLAKFKLSYELQIVDLAAEGSGT